MAKVLVTYFSRTGNTQKIAEAIHGALDGEPDLLPMDKVKDLRAHLRRLPGPIAQRPL
jgi:flavodoxin